MTYVARMNSMLPAPPNGDGTAVDDGAWGVASGRATACPRVGQHGPSRDQLGGRWSGEYMRALACVLPRSTSPWEANFIL